jgi:hypothetical protein
MADSRLKKPLELDLYPVIIPYCTITWKIFLRLISKLVSGEINGKTQKKKESRKQKETGSLESP